MAEVIHRSADPRPGHFEQGRHLFLADAELAGNGDDVPEIPGHITAASTELGHLVGTGAPLVQGGLVEFILFGHVIAFGQPRHGERSTVVVRLAHDDQLARKDSGGQVRECAFQGQRTAHHRHFIVQFLVPAGVPVGKLVGGR